MNITRNKFEIRSSNVFLSPHVEEWVDYRVYTRNRRAMTSDEHEEHTEMKYMSTQPDTQTRYVHS